MVFSKIDLEKVVKLISNPDISFIFISVLFVILGQISAAERMRFYLRDAGYEFSKLYTTCFYFIGTMFNVVLPGGIGGDGYKTYYFQKRFRIPWQKTRMVVIRGRASGLLFLCIFFLGLSFFYYDQVDIKYILPLLITASILVLPCYSFLAKKLLKEDFKTQIGAMKYSFVTQFFYLLAISSALYSIKVVDSMIGYLIVFQIANIVAIIPISIGGIGLREYTFIVIATYIGLNSDIGVAASILFYLIYSCVALFGLIPYLNVDRLDLEQLKTFREIRDENNKDNLDT